MWDFAYRTYTSPGRRFGFASITYTAAAALPQSFFAVGRTGGGRKNISGDGTIRRGARHVTGGPACQNPTATRRRSVEPAPRRAKRSLRRVFIITIITNPAIRSTAEHARYTYTEALITYAARNNLSLTGIRRVCGDERLNICVYACNVMYNDNNAHCRADVVHASNRRFIGEPIRRDAVGGCECVERARGRDRRKPNGQNEYFEKPGRAGRPPFVGGNPGKYR